MSDKPIDIKNTLELNNANAFCGELHQAILEAIDYTMADSDQNVALVIGVLETIKTDIINSLLVAMEEH